MGLIEDVRLITHARDLRGRARTPRSAEEWAPKHEPREFPTGWARTRPARAAREGIRRGVMQPLVRSQTRVDVHGADRLAKVRGPVVIVANHTSHLDAPTIIGALPDHLAKRTAVGAAADYFFDARWRASITALVFNAFPIERLGGGRNLRSIAPELIADGWSLLIFPEGTRSEDGWMKSFRTGGANLCIQNGVPAVPIAIRGAYAAMPRGRNWPRPGRPRVALHFGRPLYPRDDETPREFSRRMYDAVRTLWAEEDLGWWEAQKAAARDRLPDTTGPDATSWRRVWEATRPLAGGSGTPSPIGVPRRPSASRRIGKVWRTTRR
jgi:1-acyl-sn-glycerol-3-phosphate acyltransferase